MKFVFQKEPVFLYEKESLLGCGMVGDGPFFRSESIWAVLAKRVQADPERVPAGTMRFCRAWIDACGLVQPRNIVYPGVLSPLFGRRVELYGDWSSVPVGWYAEPLEEGAWIARVKRAEREAGNLDGPVYASEPMPPGSRWWLYVLDGELAHVEVDPNEAKDSRPPPAGRFASFLAWAMGRWESAPCAFALCVRCAHEDGALSLERVHDALGLHQMPEMPAALYAQMIARRWAEIGLAGQTRSAHECQGTQEGVA